MALAVLNSNCLFLGLFIGYVFPRDPLIDDISLVGFIGIVLGVGTKIQ
jgi:hypothetical protein